MTFVVAIDGPSASGKGTIAKIVAKELNWDYLNTGSLYRAVAYFAFKRNIDLQNVNALVDLIGAINFRALDGLNLWSSNVSEGASIVAAAPQIRDALFAVQRDFVNGKTGVIMEGRDIGTVIFPEANVKIYITAALEERANRRFKQLQSGGEEIIYDDVLRNLQVRDSRDSGRENAPLVAAADYYLVDTTDVDVAQAAASVLKLVRDAL